MNRSLVLCAALAATVSCGGTSTVPAVPSPVPTPTAPSPPVAQTWKISGAITDTVTGNPVRGATLAFEGLPALLADGSGAWTLEGTGFAASSLAVIVSAPGYLSRETAVRWQASGRQGVGIDLIPDAAPFSLSFYRQFVRNGYQSPESLEPLRRWTRPPNFYINTFNPKTGNALTPAELSVVVETIRVAVPQLTGGMFSAGDIESGNAERERRTGYINVKFTYEPSGDYCGLAYVGIDPGEITINYDRCASVCGSLKVSPETIAHEVGHAMGFWHTTGRHLMTPSWDNKSCSNVAFSDVERTHARIAYLRPIGSMDQDRDPSSFFAIHQAAPPPLAICRR